MSCFKCGSHFQAIRKYTITEKAKGSPSRGKNVKYVTIKVTEIKCKDCQAAELTYV